MSILWAGILNTATVAIPVFAPIVYLLGAALRASKCHYRDIEITWGATIAVPIPFRVIECFIFTALTLALMTAPMTSNIRRLIGNRYQFGIILNWE